MTRLPVVSSERQFIPFLGVNLWMPAVAIDESYRLVAWPQNAEVVALEVVPEFLAGFVLCVRHVSCPLCSTTPLNVECVRNAAAKTVRVKDAVGASLLGRCIFCRTMLPRTCRQLIGPPFQRAHGLGKYVGSLMRAVLVANPEDTIPPSVGVGFGRFAIPVQARADGQRSADDGVEEVFSAATR